MAIFLGLLLLLPAWESRATTATPSFTSLYVFGDGVCTTTDAPAASYYYGNRYCNGRVWVESLASWQGVPYVEANNLSYFGHDSTELLINTNAFTAPPDVSTALFVIWSNNADFVEFSNINIPPYDAGDIPAWTSFINQALADQQQAVTTLYNKGARTLVMPKAVDITSAPFYNLPQADRDFIRQRVIEFNAGFDTMLEGLMGSLPGLTVHRPDTFSLFEDVLANPGDYGLINPGIDAVSDLFDPPLDTGPGTTYIFWDFLHPTAKFQMHLADLAQRMISPVRVTGIAVAGGTVELTAVNLPVGRAGFVDGSGNLVNWSEDDTVTPAGTTGTISFPATGAARFYQLRFPLVWTHPGYPPEP